MVIKRSSTAPPSAQPFGKVGARAPPVPGGSGATGDACCL